jgi:hypothetical protein
LNWENKESIRNEVMDLGDDINEDFNEIHDLLPGNIVTAQLNLKISWSLTL